MSEMNVPITTMRVSNMVMLPAWYMSCASSARNSSGPVVSSPSTIAVIVSPETNGLTDEQATAVATDEDVTLVLAGAGTGKTAVITGKTAHLVRNQGVTPAEVLVLAFNQKAAAEIRERLPDDLRGVDVCTFHAFGRHVVAQSTGKQPTVSKLAEDDEHRKSAINGTLDEMMNSPRHREVLVNLLAYHRNDYRSPFDFKTADEYYAYMRSTELRTLSGVRVRSLEEVQVANFLSLNGVEFEYEKPYDVERRALYTGNTRALAVWSVSSPGTTAHTVSRLQRVLV